jgi:tetratricopeptide (TPR) repeat protein
MEYIFKHALAQEVVYNGLLKKERQAIHEKIGTVMEQLFQDRLPEFYETLAFHFQQGQSILKAVDYLIKAGEKSLNRYSLEEAHRYYQEAFDILSHKENRSREEDTLIIDLLSKWFLVYYYYGDWKGLTELLLSHKDLAESLDDKATLGRFYACLGFVLSNQFSKLRESYDYLHQAIHLGEEANNRQVIGYGACWMTYTCAYLGLMDQGIAFGQKAQEMARFFPADHYLYFKSLSGIGFNYYLKGEGTKVSEIGKDLLEYGRRHSNIRAMVVGHVCMGMSGGATGDFHMGIQSGQMGTKIALDRLYKYWPRTVAAINYTLIGQLAEAQEAFDEVSSYSHDYGCDALGVPSDTFLGAIYIAQGDMSRGLTMIGEIRDRCEESGAKYWLITAEFILGRIYKQIAEGAGPLSPAMIIKNIGFLIKNVPFAARKAENHFLKAIEVAQEIGAKGILGQVKLDLGLLHKTKRKTDEARKCITDAIQLFEECEADVYLKQAREALAALG